MPARTKVYIIGPVHMTKVVAALPTYGKNPLNISSSEPCQMSLKLGIQQKGLEPLKTYINDDPGLTLTYFTTRSTFTLLH